MSVRAHDACSPSSLARRLACPGSMAAEEGLPDLPSKYSEEGDIAHELLEALVGQGHRPKGYLDYPGMYTSVKVAVDWVNKHIEDGYKLYCEVRVYPSSWLGRDDTKGYADIVLVKGDHAIVADYKHGVGTVVDPIGNTQLLALAAGVVVDPTIHQPGSGTSSVSLVIIQPRAIRTESIRSWDLSMEELREECDVIKAGLAAMVPWATSAGPQCKHCKARMGCPARTGAYNNLEVEANEMRSSGEEPSAELLAGILDRAPFTRAFLDDMAQLASARISQGVAVPGYKLIKGVGRRKWGLEDEELMKKFKSMKLTLDECAPRKLGSPAQIEKIEKLTIKQRANLTKLWCSTTGKDKLVVETAAGEALVFDSSEAFADFTEAEEAEIIETVTFI